MDRGRSGLSRRLFAGLLLLCLIVLTALPAAAQEGTPPAQGATPAATPAPVRPPDAVAGSATYAQYCAPCHGTLGDGKGPSAAGLNASPAAFNNFGLLAGLPLSEMFTITKNGRMDRMMPPWGQRLSDQQIVDVVGYAWTLHTSEAEVESGKKAYDANCASCHGADGIGKNGAPDLTDYGTTSTQTQNDWLKAIASGRGQMPAFDGKLSTADQRAAAEYARSLSFTRMYRGPLPAGSGTITGTLVNATTGTIMPNLPITLTVFENQALAKNVPATTDAAGKYTFSQLPTDPTLEYQVSTEYPAGIPYATDPTTFPTNTVSLALPLHVFETTTDGSGISADRLHFIVQFDPTTSMAQIAELIVFNHDSDRTYVGDQNHAVLKIDLPAGAQQLEISDGELGARYLAADKGFVDTLPLPPGVDVRQLLFRYALPYTGDTLDLTHALAYPIANVNALVADMGEKVSSAQLQDQGPAQTQMGNYFNLSGQNLEANQSVTLQFTDLSKVTAASSSSTDVSAVGSATPAANSTDRILLIGLVAVVVMAVTYHAGYPLMRRRQLAAQPEAVTADREGLVDELARLDMAHEANEIGDAEYRDRRVRLKAQLLDLMRREGSK